MGQHRAPVRPRSVLLAAQEPLDLGEQAESRQKFRFTV